jgi:hypothetical protein
MTKCSLTIDEGHRVEVSNGIRIECAVLDISAEGAKIILTHAIPAGNGLSSERRVPIL